MSVKDWPARAGTVALLWLALIQNPMAAISVEDVSGNPLDEVTVGLFVDGLRLDSVPGPFDIVATLTFDSNLTLDGVAAGPDAALATVYWPPFVTTPNTVNFNTLYNTDPGPFMNAELLRLTFTIGAGAGPGPFPIAVTQNYQGASIVPLPPAIALFSGALAAFSMFRRRV